MSALVFRLVVVCPTSELSDLADAGRLHEPEVLALEVRRMLADPKSRAMAEDFAGQWLRVGSLADLAEPDKKLFPEYTPELRDAMVEEAVSFFHAILREDRPVLELLDSYYTFLNEPLAKHYGIEGVTGPDFRRVELKDRRRGGVLGMAAVLTLTSYPRRTSPVLRGKWVLEELLGTPPPPPPAMVKSLPTDDRIRNGLTFRQRLEQHRQKAQCASCHARLDPLGFGLENFDVLGRWRDQVQQKPVDASGKLTTGEEFAGAVALKTILVETKRELFVRNLVERMLSYALRRGLEYYDAKAVKANYGGAGGEGLSAVRHWLRRWSRACHSNIGAKNQGRPTMSLKNRPITRRTVLRGVGAVVGLPLLEAMRPATAPWPQRLATARPTAARRSGWPACSGPTAATPTPGLPKDGVTSSSFHRSSSP